MDYLEFFGLKEDPFTITPDLTYFYPSKEHNEILTALNYAVTQKEGFFLATGEPGTGKTTILKVFIDEWKHKAEIALVLTPRLSPEEFLHAVLEDLKVSIKDKNKNEMLKAFRDFLLSSISRGKAVIIVVDEAQNLSDETLEELRLLSNLETEREKLLQIVLIGQTELRERLASDNMKQLSQRVMVKASLRPLTREETSDYINYRSMKAGKGLPVFEEDAKNLIFKYSKGVPRLINLVSSRALMAAYVDGSTDIKKHHVRYAIDHLTEREKRSYGWMSYSKYAAIVVLAILIGVAGGLGFRRIAVEYKDQKIEKPVELSKVTEETKPVPEIQPEAAKPKVQLAVVAVHSAILRQEPSIDSAPVTYVSKGTILKVVEEKAGENEIVWHKVKISDGRECWISGKVVQLKEQ
ncbi:MAG TPA: AAA family ATPase [Syntrophorhabdus sp.]|jgi:general secretion pathway protein A|nr:AAA family ATPase [Syntrophorhabdus sp.]